MNVPVSNFLERLESVSDSKEFEKVCEDLAVSELAGNRKEFHRLFGLVVDTRNRILGPEGARNEKAEAAIRHTFLEAKRVAPPLVERIGIGPTYVFRSRRCA